MNTELKLYRLLLPVLGLMFFATVLRHQYLREQRDKSLALAIDFQKAAKQWQTASEQWEQASMRFEHEATNCQAMLISVLK